MATPIFTFDVPVEGDPLDALPLRMNLNALGTTCYTTDAGYPTAPQTGMLRIYDAAGAGTNVLLQYYWGGAWVTLINHLESLASVIRRLEFAFAAAATWTINHNLGVRPIVQCYDAADSILAPVNIQHVLVGGAWNRVVVSYGAPQAGYAILNG